jgi:carbamoyltransferase
MAMNILGISAFYHDSAACLVREFQGRMEFGPRALGNPSILGDARSPGCRKH